MSGNADEILKGIYASDIVEERRAAARVAYEERIVKKILVRGGLDGEIGKLCMRAKEKTGKARLTFEWFYEEYPSFPVYLSMRKVPFVYQVTPKDLFNKFCSTPMFKIWEEFRDEAPVRDRPVALVFDWPAVKGTQMVIHNWERPQEWFDGNLRLIRSIGTGRKLQLITIEQFEPFFECVFSGWIK
jgi:hypothetical protein